MNSACNCNLCGTLRTLDADGSVKLKQETPCAFCEKPTTKGWPSWGGFVAACSQDHAQKADDALALELEQEGM